MLKILLSPIVDIISTSVKGLVDTKKAKAKLKVTEIKAKTSMMKAQIKGEAQWDLEAIRGSQSSWKDEYLTIIFSLPLILSFIPFTVTYVERGFESLSKTPDWYFFSLGLIVSASFGIKSATKIFKK